MCLKCHQGLDDDDVIQMITESINNPKYENWNSVSLGHLSLSILGLNGDEASELAEHLLNNYIEWKTNDGIWNAIRRALSLSPPIDEDNPSVEEAEHKLAWAKSCKAIYKRQGLESDDIKHLYEREEIENKEQLLNINDVKEMFEENEEK